MARKSILLIIGSNRVLLKPSLHSRLSIVSLLLLLALFVSPFERPANAHSEALNRATANWTFMVYLDGDNDLERYGIGDFAEMASVGSTTSVNILVQFDRINGWDSTNGNWTDTRRFRVTKGMLPTAANGTTIGEANMGDPKTLVNFVQWGMATYPANNYAVILWDHGEGWRAASTEEVALKGIAFDDTQNDYLSSPELRSAMATLSNNGANPIDLVGFDACLMGMIEVDRQLIPYVDVRVGSEETIPVNGWPYRTIVSDLINTPSMSAGYLATVITNRYYSSYGNSEEMAAVNLGSSYTALLNAVNNFAGVLISKGGTYHNTITTARNNTLEFYDPDYIDLYDFAYEIKQRINNSVVDAAAQSVMDAVSGTVIHERHGASWPGAHGISIYFPVDKFSYDPMYDGRENWLQFTIDTQWDEWLNAYYYPPVTLTPPVLVAPTNGALIRNRKPAFKWNPSAKATKYQIQIDNDSNFSSPVLTTIQATTSYTAASALGNITYYWRVRAGNSTTWSAWSASRNFTIDTFAPDAPVLDSPTNQISISYTTPTFTWNAVATATLYQIQVADNPDFLSPVFTANRGVTSFTGSTPLSRKVYYWRVRARDAAGNWSAWSYRWLFRIVLPAIEPALQPTKTPVPTDVPTLEPSTETPTPVITETPTDVPGPVLQLVESDTVFQSGLWTVHDTDEASGGRYIYSSGSLEDVLSVSFYGTQFEVVYIQHPALGVFAVELDGVVLQMVNSLAGDAVFNVRANFSGLPYALHTLRLYPVSGLMAIDAFLVEQLAELVQPTPTIVPTETSVPPTDIPTETLMPPTDIPTETPTAVPTETLIPPTDIPTETPIPPTDIPTETPTAVPTETLIPPTETATEPENTGS